MEFKNNMSSINSMRDIIEDYLLCRKAKALHRKAKALHRKQLALVHSEIKAHYAFHHLDDDEWFLNDLKNHDHQSEPRLSCYDIRLHYTYRTRNGLYGTGQCLSIDKLLTDFGRETILSYLV